MIKIIGFLLINDLYNKRNFDCIDYFDLKDKVWTITEMNRDNKNGVIQEGTILYDKEKNDYYQVRGKKLNKIKIIMEG